MNEHMSDEYIKSVYCYSIPVTRIMGIHKDTNTTVVHNRLIIKGFV